MRRRAALVAGVLAAGLLLAGCTEQGDGGVDSGLTQNVSQWKQPTTEPVTFSGPTVTGGTFDSKRYLGEVVVVNFWYAGCGPCRGEAADLNAVAASETAKGVQFVGVDVSDERATAAGFVSTYRVRYPSILDQAVDGSVQLAFTKSKPPSAIPSTLVLDRKGRVVARIIGAINRSVLTTLIGDAVDGSAS